MSKVTVNDLRDFVKRANKFQALSGSNYYFKEQGRNGHQAIDLYRVREDGSKGWAVLVELGTSKECIERGYLERHNYHGKISHTLKPTRKMAKRVLSHMIDFSKEYHYLREEELEALEVWAKLSKYRKPSGTKYPRSWHFYKHLVQKVSI